MRIVRIDVYKISYELVDKLYAWSRGHSVSLMDSTIVKITTDEGLTGYGECCPLGSAYMSAYPEGVRSGLRELGPMLLGRDPLQIDAINVLMDHALSGHNYVKSPIDIACWDILGQATGQPVCTLLGGRYVDDYPLYRPISQGSPEKMAEDVVRFLSEGYHRFQLKVGGDPDEDIARIKAVLKVTGLGDVVIADANTGWTMHGATRVVNGLAQEDVYIEQPCLTLTECLVIRARTSLPMVIDELITGIGTLLEAYEKGAMDVINIKLSRVGGLTKAKQIRDLAQNLGLGLTLEDSHGGDIITTAIAHLVGSTRPDFFFASTDQNSYNKERLAEDAPRRKDGRLPVPTAPGLGIHVDESALGEPVFTVP